MNYIVVFSTGLEIPIEERVFEERQDASCYKAEHEQGKFASVLSLKLESPQQKRQDEKKKGIK